MADHSTQTDLFSPYTMGALQLANRIVMAPITRSAIVKKAFRTTYMPFIMRNVPAPDCVAARN